MYKGKIRFLFQMPNNAGYFGGIAFILHEYLKSKEEFDNLGYEIDLWDYSGCSCNNDLRKIDKFRTLIRSIKYIKRKLLKNNDTIYHIHTSTGWTLIKDLIISLFIRRKIKNNGKIVLTIHFAEIEKIFLKNKFFRFLEIRVIKSVFDKLILLSARTKKELELNGIPECNTALLYTFHTFDNIALKCKGNNNKQDIKIMFMGSLDKRKGIIDLLKALKKIEEKEIVIDIYGKFTDEETKNEYDRLIKELDKRVVFHGYVSGDKKEEAFQNADIFILPSYAEGMPIVIMEAIAFGCAIISTKVGAIPEIVLPENGLLVCPGDIGELTKNICFLINNKKILYNMQENNIRVGKKYGKTNHIKQLTKIYDELCEVN